MQAEKRNAFLDAGNSDGDDDASQAYASDADLRKGGRSAKRRRIQDDGRDGDGSSGEDGSDEGGGPPNGAKAAPKLQAGKSQAVPDEPEEDEDLNQEKEKRPKSKDASLPILSRTPLQKKNRVSTDAAIRKSGVVYLSRVPPFMKPAKLRSLLEPHGTINRIFLTPEDPSARGRRVRAGGNKKPCFVDGWAEFVRKKDAKRAVELLNARPIGGKKGSYYRDDIWNLVYLKGFKWRDLTEQMAAEEAERASRMRAELAKTTRENKEFVRNVERAKMLEGMEAKKAAKRKRVGGEENGEAESDGGDEALPRHRRAFRQTSLLRKRNDDAQPESVQRVLSKIF